MQRKQTSPFITLFLIRITSYLNSSLEFFVELAKIGWGLDIDGGDDELEIMLEILNTL
jgi:hypothetical protein